MLVIFPKAEILAAVSASTSREKKILDFWRLIFCPEEEQKILGQSIIVLI